MDKKIPDNEKWIHTPEMKAKLTRADAWMRDTTPKETDLDELERRLEENEVFTHITPAGANIFLDLGFPPDEAEALLAESDRKIAEDPARNAAGYIVLQLCFDYGFKPIGSDRSILNITERLRWERYYSGGEYAYRRTNSTISDALDLLQTMKAELPWFNKALDAAWASEVLKTMNLNEVLEPGDGE